MSDVTGGELRRMSYGGGRTLAYRVHPGAGVPLVLVHGAGSSSASWDPVVARLVAAGRSVVVADLPGHGDSCTRPGTYHPQDSVDALELMISREGWAQVHLVGHSLGGALVVGLDQALGDGCRSVTLVSPGGLGRGASIPLRAAALPGADAALAVAFSKTTLDTLAFAGRVLDAAGVRHVFGPDELGSIAWLGDRARRSAFLSTIRHVVGVGGQRMSTLPQLTGQDGRRFLLVWGADDPVLPVGHGYRARTLLPGSALHVFPGAGHEPHAHDPDRFAGLLLAHAAAHDPAPDADENPAAVHEGNLP